MRPNNHFLTWLSFSLVICRLTQESRAESLSDSEQAVVDAQYELMDSILEDLVQKYDKIKSDTFWHSYDFGSGGENREGFYY